jgi:RNA polymerase sigma factor (sigma-70 family)
MSVNATTVMPAAPSRLVPRRLLSDERLTRLAAAGDSAAFSTIFERFHQQLYRYCRAILSDHDEAQDALQSTMAAALRSLPGEERKIALRPWLYRIAHNEAISIVRRRSDSAPDIGEGQPHGLAPPPGTEWGGLSAPSAQAGAEQRERLRELVSDLSALPERQRGALVMRELSGLSYAEIASALDSGESAARQTVYEARESLRESKRGREMDCSTARQSLSERDGRIMRGRALRAHLRTCEGCQDFRAAISDRGRDLQLLSPPLSAVAATSLLGAVLGHGAGGGGTAATLGGAGAAGAGAGGAGAVATAAGAGGSAAILAKGGAVVAALVVGAGAAGATGAIDLPIVGSDDQAASSAQNPGATAPEAENPAKGSADSARGDGGKAAGRDGDGKRAANENSQGAAHSQAGKRGQAGEHGNGNPSLGSGTDHELPPNSQGASPPGNAVGNPHTTGSTPGAGASPPRSESGAENTNAGAGGPPANSNAGGNGGNPHG